MKRFEKYIAEIKIMKEKRILVKVAPDASLEVLEKLLAERKYIYSHVEEKRERLSNDVLNFSSLITKAIDNQIIVVKHRGNKQETKERLNSIGITEFIFLS